MTDEGPMRCADQCLATLDRVEAWIRMALKSKVPEEILKEVITEIGHAQAWVETLKRMLKV